MDRFNIPLTAERLTAYAIERQNGTERYQYPDTPAWADQRRSWTDAILQGMARLDGLTPDPGWMEQFDQQMDAACGCSKGETLPMEEQTALIRDLSMYVSTLETTGDDRRRQIDVVRNLMEDIYTHPPWSQCRIAIEKSIRSMTDILMHMTAQRPIRFTYLTLSGYPVPCTSDFVSGIVKDEEAFKATELYQNMVGWHPQMQHWIASTTIYIGGNGGPSCDVVDATDFDMSIIRGDEYRFLKQQGLCAVDHAEFHIPAYETIRVLRVEPGAAPEPVTMPNTLDAFQEAVGGDIEVLGLDTNAMLVCNGAGKLIGLPANRQVECDTIAGTFLVVGAEDGEFCSLTDADAAHYAEQFAQPMPSFSSPDEPTQWEFYVL